MAEFLGVIVVQAREDEERFEYEVELILEHMLDAKVRIARLLWNNN